MHGFCTLGRDQLKKKKTLKESGRVFSFYNLIVKKRKTQILNVSLKNTKKYLT